MKIHQFLVAMTLFSLILTQEEQYYQQIPKLVYRSQPQYVGEMEGYSKMMSTRETLLTKPQITQT